MFQIKNYMEEVVYRQIEEVIKDMNMCDCKKCRMDIAAISLNNLPPKYVVSEKGELYSKVNSFMQQFDVDVVAAITKAAAIVKKNPRHDDR